MSGMGQRADLSEMRLDRIRIPARCPHCGAVHNFYYRWLRCAGGFDCLGCRSAVEIDLKDVDEAMDGVCAAIDSLSQAVGRLAVDAWKPQPPVSPGG